MDDDAGKFNRNKIARTVFGLNDMIMYLRRC